MRTDAELIDIQKNKQHAGMNHRVVMTRHHTSGKPCRAVEFTDDFGNRVQVMASDLVAGES